MLTTIVIAVAAVAVVLMAALYFLQTRMVFFPMTELAIMPEDVGLTYDNVGIPVTPDHKLHAWYFPADSAAITILFCHGNAGNISHRLETAAFLVGQGYNALIFDYRGYGLSDGAPSEENVYQDAAAAYQWLKTEKQAAPDQIVLFGRSLGGAVAVDLARRVPCRALVLESTFSSAADMADRMIPWLPVRWLLRYRFDSIAKVRDITVPVLVVHSPTDEIVPYAFGKKLFAAANEPKQFVDIRGGHNERAYLADPAYQAALRAVISAE